MSQNQITNASAATTAQNEIQWDCSSGAYVAGPKLAEVGKFAKVTIDRALFIFDITREEVVKTYSAKASRALKKRVMREQGRTEYNDQGIPFQFLSSQTRGRDSRGYSGKYARIEAIGIVKRSK